MGNIMFQNISYETKELLNRYVFSNNLVKIEEKQSKINQFMMKDIKSIDKNNSHDFSNDISFENINEKNIKISDFNLNNSEKENNNDIKIENNNINNQEILE
jgi:hypothetical protein